MRGVELAVSEAHLRRYRIGERAWAVQFHPEAKGPGSCGWFEEDVENLPAPLDEIERELEAKIDGWHPPRPRALPGVPCRRLSSTREPVGPGAVRPFRQQPEDRERERQPRPCPHLRRVPPAAGEADQRCQRVDRPDRLHEAPGLALLVDHDLVARAPPDLQRHVREGDRAHVGDRAPKLVGVGILRGRAAELHAGEGLQRASDRALPGLPAGGGAGELRELVDPAGPDRPPGRTPPPRRAGGDTAPAQERLLAAHAPAEGIDAARVDVHPRQGEPDDLRHPGEIGDLTRRAPRVVVEAATLAVGTHHAEAADRRQLAPELHVRPAGDAAAVR